VELAVPVGRLDPVVEAAAYFLCSEALANAAKHAEATRVSIDITELNGRLVVAIEDDGIGGADPRSGSGLRGLVDRVDALGGRLSVRSPIGRGTRLDATIPVDAQP
jgi:signal transduction histidine kinase